MTTSNGVNTIDFLKYANLQLASEAIYDVKPEANDPTNPYTGANNIYKISIAALTIGNNRNSKFTTTEATDFVNEWRLLEHLPNTATGFSGSLFTSDKTGEVVLSFRSTEFLDDAVRDNTATNVLEIKNTGFAWGQIDDMQAWFSHLQSKGYTTGPPP